MKLLFDENISGELPRLIADVFPESADVLRLGLGGQSDAAIWEYAKTGGFVLVTKDEDFQRLSIFRGPPPKVMPKQHFSRSADHDLGAASQRTLNTTSDLRIARASHVFLFDLAG